MTMSAVCAQPLAARKSMAGSRVVSAKAPVQAKASRKTIVTRAGRDGPVIIGLAADSGCGKSTFMRRMTSLFGGKASAPEGGNPESNTLISDTTTVLCLDDYHLNDRAGRKTSGLTALNLKEQNFGAPPGRFRDMPLGGRRGGGWRRRVRPAALPCFLGVRENGIFLGLLSSRFFHGLLDWGAGRRVGVVSGAAKCTGCGGPGASGARRGGWDSLGTGVLGPPPLPRPPATPRHARPGRSSRICCSQ